MPKTVHFKRIGRDGIGLHCGIKTQMLRCHLFLATMIGQPGSLDQLNVASALDLLKQAGISVADPSVVDEASWIQSIIDGLCALSSRDPLTGLFNRRQFEAALEREIDRVARVGEPALLMIFDIDHFKAVNDNYGHAAGDLVLADIGRTLADCVRPMDTVARIGGEEFAAILPNCPSSFASRVAERIRNTVEQQIIDIDLSRTLQVTMSIGGAFAHQWVRSSGKLWIERADQQLYRAKNEGRNRVCLEQVQVTEVSAEEKGMLFAMSPNAIRHV